MSVLDAFIHDPLVEWEDETRKRVCRFLPCVLLLMTQTSMFQATPQCQRQGQRQNEFIRHQGCRFETMGQVCATANRTEIERAVFPDKCEGADLWRDHKRRRGRTGNLDKQSRPDAHTRVNRPCKPGRLPYFVSSSSTDSSLGQDVSWMGCMALGFIPSLLIKSPYYIVE
jgi:hypothetical protein